MFILMPKGIELADKDGTDQLVWNAEIENEEGKVLCSLSIHGTESLNALTSFINDLNQQRRGRPKQEPTKLVRIPVRLAEMIKERQVGKETMGDAIERLLAEGEEEEE